MPTSRSLMLAAFAIVAGAASAVAQAPAPTPQGDSAAVVAAVERFHAALIAGDSASAVALLAPDLVVLESGSLETRAEYLGHHLGADLKAAQTSRGERTVTKATVAGDMAYVASRTVPPAAAAAAASAAAGSEMVELMVLTRTSDGWKISAVHWSSRRRR